MVRYLARMTSVTTSDPTVPPEDDAEDVPRCKCGTDRLSKFSVVDREYTFLGTLYALWGGTSVPSKVSFRCVKCGAKFESTSTRQICRDYTT